MTKVDLLKEFAKTAGVLERLSYQIQDREDNDISSIDIKISYKGPEPGDRVLLEALVDCEFSDGWKDYLLMKELDKRTESEGA